MEVSGTAAAGEGRHVLVIEDDAAIGHLVSLILSTLSFRVSVARDGEAGLASAREDPPDVVLLDLTLPGLSGQETLAELKKRTLQVPVIILTAADSEDVLTECLQLGAFDITQKPFEPDALETAVTLAVGAEVTPPASSPKNVRGSDFEIDFASYVLTIDGRRTLLSYSEWRLLEVLALRPGETVLYQELLGRVWGPQFRNQLTFLQAWMSRLQKKIGLAEFHGVGYSLVV